MPTIVHTALLLVILPAWLLVGLADWYCHRKSQIERTTGARESVLHLLLSLEASVAILAAMFLEIDALVLIVVVVAFAVHEITTHIDIVIALPARPFTAIEQRVHDYLTAIPFAAVCLLLATHVDDMRGLFGDRAHPADWSLRWKSPALPVAYLVGWNLAALLLNIAPYTEELVRCLRAGAAARRDAAGEEVSPRRS